MGTQWNLLGSMHRTYTEILNQSSFCINPFPMWTDLTSASGSYSISIIPIIDWSEMIRENLRCNTILPGLLDTFSAFLPFHPTFLQCIFLCYTYFLGNIHLGNDNQTICILTNTLMRC